MATNVGHVELTVDADGKGLPRQIKNIGKQAGAAGGLALSKGFRDSLSKLGREMQDDMTAHGELAGISFTDAFQSKMRARSSGIANELADAFAHSKGLDEYAQRLGGVEPAIESIRGKMEELHRTGGLNEVMWNRNSVTLNKWAVGARAAEKDAAALAAAEERVRARTEEINKAHGDALVIDKQRTQVIRDHIAALKQNEAFDARREDSIRRMASLQIQAIKENERFDASIRNGGNGIDDFVGKTDKGSAGVGRFGDGLSHNTKQVIFWTSVIASAAGNISVLGSAAGSSLAVLGGSAVAAGLGIGVAVAAFKNLNGDLADLPAVVRPAAAEFQALGGIFDTLQDRIQIAAITTLGDDFKALGGLVQDLTPSFEIMAGAVNAVASSFIGALTSAEGFTMLSGLIEGFSTVFESVALGAGSLVAAIGGIFLTGMPFIQSFADGFATLMEQFNQWTQSVGGQNAIATFFEHGQEVMGPFMNLIGEVGKMLASLVTPQTIQATVQFIDNLSAFMPVLGQILGVVAQLDVFGVLAQLLLAIGAAITPILPQLTDLAVMISQFLIQAFVALAPILAQVLAQLAPLALQLAAQLIPAFMSLMPVVMQIATDILPLLVDILMALVPIIAPLVTIIAKGLTLALTQAAPAIENLALLLKLVADVITSVVIGTVKMLQAAIKGDLMGTFTQFGVMWNRIWAQVGQFTETWVGRIVSATQGMVRDIVRWWNSLPADIRSAVSGIASMVTGFFDDIPGNISRIVNDIVGFFTGLPGRIMSAIGGLAGRIQSQLNIDIPFLASGGLAGNGAQIAVIGEAGPEAVVPLNRPLSQVDPSVRDLSAVAQGIRPASGTTSGPSKIINVAEGAITVVSPAADAGLVATSVLDNIVKKL